MDGSLRLMGGEAGPGYEYGRLEIFLKGFWSTVCDTESFTPDSAQVACRALGHEGGAALEFRRRQPFAGISFVERRQRTFEFDNQVSKKFSTALNCTLCNCMQLWRFVQLPVTIGP